MYKTDRQIMTDIYLELTQAGDKSAALDWACARLYDHICDTLPEHKARPEDLKAWDDYCDANPWEGWADSRKTRPAEMAAIARRNAIELAPSAVFGGAL